MIRRSARLVALCLAVAALLAAAPTAAGAAAGPQLGMLHVSSEFEVTAETFGAEGNPLATLLPPAGRTMPRPFVLGSVAWNGDGRYMLLTGQVGTGSRADSAAALHLYAVPGDGGPPVEIPGTAGALFPLGFPDGEAVAFLRSRGSESEEVSADTHGNHHVVHRGRVRSSIWLARIDGGKPRRLTPWRTDGFDLPTSVSPDGSTLALTRVRRDDSKSPRSRSEAVLLDLGTGRSSPLGSDVGAAVFSPDGTKLAVTMLHRFRHPQVRKAKHGTTTLYGETDVYVEDRATGALTQITRGPGLDGSPAWDPSGQRLAFVRSGDLAKEEAEFGIGDSVYEVNADGSCLTRVLHEKKAGFGAPAWRPGPDRGAGPISC